MAGVYIHIPFCRKACHYCNFHFSTSLHQKPALVNAIAKEITAMPLPAGVIAERNISTIYFGGGTPSILETTELQQLLSALSDSFNIAQDAEITLEANPDDINPVKLESWKLLGINRLSMGVQSFAEADLQWMNRAHNAGQAIRSIGLAKSFGFNDLTVDLIYGTPTLTDEQWLRNIDTTVSLGVNHLSCYALTVEEKTALNHFIKKGKLPPVDEEKQGRHFDMLMKQMKTLGFEHYEISNFARPGHRSRHNSNYWSGDAYYGFGPAAHSFNGKQTRWFNVASNPLYVAAINKNEAAFSFENLTAAERLNEIIMTGLRTIEGISPGEIKLHFEALSSPVKQWDEFSLQLAQFVKNGMVTVKDHRAVLTQQGIHFADGIASALFVS